MSAILIAPAAALIPAVVLWLVIVVGLRSVRPEYRQGGVHPHEVKLFLASWAACAVLILLFGAGVLDPRRVGYSLDRVAYSVGFATAPGLLLWLAVVMFLRSVRPGLQGYGVIAFLASLGGCSALMFFVGEPGGQLAITIATASFLIALPIWVITWAAGKIRSRNSPDSPAELNTDSRSRK